jgi:hypothetical protein
MTHEETIAEYEHYRQAPPTVETTIAEYERYRQASPPYMRYLVLAEQIIFMPPNDAERHTHQGKRR